MYCKNCGSQVEEGKYCQDCGALALKTSDEEQHVNQSIETFNTEPIDESTFIASPHKEQKIIALIAFIFLFIVIPVLYTINRNNNESAAEHSSEVTNTGEIAQSTLYIGENISGTAVAYGYLGNQDGFYLLAVTFNEEMIVIKSRATKTVNENDIIQFEGIVSSPIELEGTDGITYSFSSVEVRIDKIYVTGRANAINTEQEPVEQENFSYLIINEDNWTIVKDSYGSGYTWSALISVYNDGNVPIYFGITNFDLHTSDGKVITTGILSSFPDILNPGEEGVFWGYESLESYSEEDGIVFTPRWSVEKSNNKRIDLSYTDFDIRQTSYGINVVGNMTNDTGVDQEWVIIQAILYDKDGNALGVWMENDMEAFKVGDKRAFVVDGSGRTLKNVTFDMVDSYSLFINPPNMWN